MASTAWMSRPASPKQIVTIQKVADEKVVSGLHDELLDRLADVASGIEITGGEASELITALFAAPRKAKPSAGFAPLVSNRAERLAKAKEAKERADALEAAYEAALAAAGGKARALGLCVTCGHSADTHEGRTGKCSTGEWVHYGYDSDYYHDCQCTAFIEAGPLHDAARTAAAPIAAALHSVHEAERDAEEFCRGDRVVVARGRKVPKGSKGAVIKVDYEGRYGASTFLLLDDGSRAWTSLSNVDHEEV